MAFDSEIKYKGCSSKPHADAMRRLNFDQDDDECNLVEYSGPDFDDLCVNLAEHKPTPFEELRSEFERTELSERKTRRVVDGNWKAGTHAESVFKKVSGFLTVENGLHNESKFYIPPKMRIIIIERAQGTYLDVQTTKNIVNLIYCWPGVGRKKCWKIHWRLL